MKKISLAIFAAVLAAGIILACTACSPNYVNTSGNYRAATAEEVAAATENVDMELSDTFRMYYLIDIEGDGVKLLIEYDGMMRISDSGITAKLSLDLEMSSSVGNTTSSTASDYDVYIDNEYVYLSDGKSKVKTPIDSQNVGIELPSFEFGNILDGISDPGNDCEIAEFGNTVKIRMKADLSDIIDTAFGIGIGGNISAEFYVITESGKLTGIAAKCDGKIEAEEEHTDIKVDIQLASTDKEIEPPSDLDEYEAKSVSIGA